MNKIRTTQSNYISPWTKSIDNYVDNYWADVKINMLLVLVLS